MLLLRCCDGDLIFAVKNFYPIRSASKRFEIVCLLVCLFFSFYFPELMDLSTEHARKWAISAWQNQKFCCRHIHSGMCLSWSAHLKSVSPKTLFQFTFARKTPTITTEISKLRFTLNRLRNENIAEQISGQIGLTTKLHRLFFHLQHVYILSVRTKSPYKLPQQWLHAAQRKIAKR